MGLSSAPDAEATDVSAAVDVAAQALIAIFDAARVRADTVLSSAQLRALQIVERDGGLNLGAFADALGLQLSSASRLSDRLIAAGMIERTQGSFDRREISLHLTTDGKLLLAGLRDQRQHLLDQVLRAMTPAASRALVRGLREFSRAANLPRARELSA